MIEVIYTSWTAFQIADEISPAKTRIEGVVRKAFEAHAEGVVVHVPENPEEGLAVHAFWNLLDAQTVVLR